MKERLFGLFVAITVIFITVVWAASFSWGALDMVFVLQLNRLMASLGFFFFFLQFLLSSRVKLIEDGFGLDRMIRYHRMFGRVALSFLFLHPILLTVYEAPLGLITLHLFRVLGILALLGITLTALVAVLYKKFNMAYELWLHIHKANYILFPVAAVHVFYNARPGSPLFITWVVLSVLFLMLIVYRLWQVTDIRRHPYQVVKVKQEASDIWSLHFKGRSLAYKPGQFMFLRLLRDGQLSSSHPFTISSSPTWDVLAVTPKELGDFTSTIKDTKEGDLAYIDAPYGVFSFLNYDCDRLAFIAGGIGITPFISMLRYMNDNKIDKPVTLLWGNKNVDALCFQEELNKMAAEMENLDVVFVMSAQDGWRGEKGRIDGDTIEKHVPDLTACRCFLCGPPPFSRAVMQALKEKGVPKDRIHHELFEM